MTPANDNKSDDVASGRGASGRLFAVIAAAVVALTIVAALAVSDPPWVVRDQKRDQGTVQRLNAIQQSIANYHRNEGKLPGNLAELLASPQTTPFGATAENLKEIDYTPGGDGRAYSLCGMFLRASGAEQGFYATNWKHEAGHQCFQLKVPEKTSALGDTFYSLD